MKELINISGQQFYHSTIEQVNESCSQKENCAIIIDESYLDQLIENGRDIIGSSVNQLIIISEKVNEALLQIEGIGVFLVSAIDTKDALKLAVMSEPLSKEMICVLKEDEKTIIEMMNEIVT